MCIAIEMNPKLRILRLMDGSLLDHDAKARAYEIAKERDYGRYDVAKVFAEFRVARQETVRMLTGLAESQLDRAAVFEGYGSVTMRGLIHYLCSHDQQHLSGLQWLLGKIDASRARA